MACPHLAVGDSQIGVRVHQQRSGVHVAQVERTVQGCPARFAIDGIDVGACLEQALQDGQVVAPHLEDPEKNSVSENLGDGYPAGGIPHRCSHSCGQRAPLRSRSFRSRKSAGAPISRLKVRL